MFATPFSPRLFPRALLAISLPVLLLATSPGLVRADPAGNQPVRPDALEVFPSRGEGFSYRIEDGVLDGWADPEFEYDLLGDTLYQPPPPPAADAPEAAGPELPVRALHPVVQGLRVAPLSAVLDPTAEPPAWAEKLVVETEWSEGERPHTLELTVRIQNTTPDFVLLKKDPLVVALVPLARPQQTTRQFTQLMGWIRGDSVVSLSAGGSVDEDTQWVAYQNGFEVFVLHLLEGPGRFLVEGSTVFLDREGQQSLSGNLLLLRPVKEVHGNERITLKLRVFAGLKSEEVLREAGYPALFDLWGGWFGWIGKLMFELLKIFYALTMSWGFSIVLLTVVVKIMLHPLNRKQLESMAKMQELQPRMKAIQARYADNQQRQQQEIQKLFAEAGVNPLQGCLPIFMQIPIFFALYSCLSNAPELRGVSFLWLPDLSMPDPYLILPALFAAGIFFSSASAATDPSQKTMMQIMPLVMFFFMINIASGVMIYLAGQTVLGIFEQRRNKDLRERMKKPGASDPGDGDGDGDGDKAATVIDNDEAGARTVASEASRPGKKKKGKKAKKK